MYVLTLIFILCYEIISSVQKLDSRQKVSRHLPTGRQARQEK